MKKFERITYIVEWTDVTGKENCLPCDVTDLGSDAANEDFIIRYRLPRNAKNIIIKKTKGSFEKIPNDVLVENVIDAIKIIKTAPAGFFYSLLSKKDIDAIGPYKIGIFKESVFFIICLLDYCHTGKILRDIESERLGITSDHYHGGHRISDIFNTYMGIRIEHKKCLSNDNTYEIIKRLIEEKKIFSIEKINVEMKKDVSDLVKELILMEENAIRRQDDIDKWLDQKDKKDR